MSMQFHLFNVSHQIRIEDLLYFQFLKYKFTALALQMQKAKGFEPNLLKKTQLARRWRRQYR